MPLRQEIFRDVGLPLGIGQWFVDLQKMQLYWPRGIASQSAIVIYSWASFNEVVDRHFSENRSRFMGFIAQVVRSPNEDHTITIQARNLQNELVPLKLSARSVRDSDGAYIYGLMQTTRHSLELENQAHSLSLILDAVFSAVDGGMIVFDDQLRVRRANRKAIALLGITDLDRQPVDIFADVEARSPQEITSQLAEALRQRASVSGVYQPPRTREAYHWRGTPWGRTGIGARGVVAIFSRQEESTTTTATKLDRYGVLEHIHTPVVIVQLGTAEVCYANLAARTSLQLDGAQKYFVRNLVELCGRAVPPVAYEQIRRGAQFVNLRSGARVSKLQGQPDALLVEYLQ